MIRHVFQILSLVSPRVLTSMSAEWPVAVFTHILRPVLSYSDQYFLFKLAEAIVMLRKNSPLYVSLFDETRNYQSQLYKTFIQLDVITSFYIRKQEFKLFLSTL